MSNSGDVEVQVTIYTSLGGGQEKEFEKKADGRKANAVGRGS